MSSESVSTSTPIILTKLDNSTFAPAYVTATASPSVLNSSPTNSTPRNSTSTSANLFPSASLSMCTYTSFRITSSNFSSPSALLSNVVQMYHKVSRHSNRPVCFLVTRPLPQITFQLLPYQLPGHHHQSVSRVAPRTLVLQTYQPLRRQVSRPPVL